MKNEHKVVADQLQKLINTLLFMKKRSLVEHDGIALYPSEIHLMMTIGRKAARNATQVAEKLGVTKGALSQTISRLVKKDVLQKEKDPQHNNELSFSLTDKGEEMLLLFTEQIHNASQKHKAGLQQFSEAELAAITRFLEGANQFLADIL